MKKTYEIQFETDNRGNGYMYILCDVDKYEAQAKRYFTKQCKENGYKQVKLISITPMAFKNESIKTVTVTPDPPKSKPKRKRSTRKTTRS